MPLPPFEKLFCVTSLERLPAANDCFMAGVQQGEWLGATLILSVASFFIFVMPSDAGIQRIKRCFLKNTAFCRYFPDSAEASLHARLFAAFRPE